VSAPFLPLDAGIAVAVAFLFAVSGNAVLGRRPAGIGEWNEAFLVGAGTATALLFPASLLFGPHALTAILIVLLAGSAASLRLPARETPRPVPGSPGRWSAWTIGFLALTAAAAILFTVLDLNLGYRWDGLAIWAGKGQILHHDGTLFGTVPPAGYFLNKLRYPALVPLFEALVAKIRGAWDFDPMKPIFVLFFLSLLIGTARAARAFGSRAVAMGAAALAALLPAISTGWNLGGYADLPAAAVVAVAAGACLRETPETLSWRSPGPWLVGGLLMVKDEGIIPFTIAAGVLLAAVLFGRAASWPARAWSAVVPPMLFLGCRFGYLYRLDIPGPLRLSLFSQPFAVIVERTGLIAANAVRWLLAPGFWGVLWPAFFVAAVILFARGGGRERALASITLLCVVGYATPFLITSWPIPLHVEQAYPRLLEQAAPLAVIALAAAYARAREWASAGAPASPSPAPPGSSPR
jgi:hypothetical protein